MSLGELPKIDRLELATVTRVPDWHPEHATFAAFPVYAWVIHHPDGVIVVDTGVGFGNDLIDEWYGPDSVDLVDALGNVEVATGDVAAVVLSHLHFDHCGQQSAFTAPVHVSVEEHRAAQEASYTVPEWAAIPDQRLRLVHGDESIAEGVRILSTPGHTPGHQSLVVTAGPTSIVLGGQCAYRSVEILTGEPGETNLHDTTWREVARDSIARVRALQPCEVHLSHDASVVML
jgi:N-acyl homoserine lactone hydrolase